MIEYMIKGGSVIDGTGAPPSELDVRIIDGKITQIGDLKTKKKARVIEANGLTVMPGLIEGHNHPLGERDFRDPGFKKYYDNIVNSPALALMKGIQVIQGLLYRGVTTIRIPHPTIANAPELRGEWLVAIRIAVGRGYFPAPRVVAGGCVIPTGGHLNSMAPPFILNPGWKGADGPWEIRKQTRECLQHEVDFIKLIGPGHKRFKPGPGPEHTCMTREEIAAAVEEAHWKGVPIAAHAKNGPGLRFAIEEGVDSIEHGTYLIEQPHLIDKMVENNQFLVPTLGMFFYEPLVDAYDGAEPGTKDNFEAMRPDLIKNFKECVKKGVKIAAGTDNTFWWAPGVAWEMETYVKYGGMKPMDAIISATKTNAENCALLDVGTIEVGKKADIILVEGDPLKDISVLQARKNISLVMKEGQIIVEQGRLNWPAWP
jgi:imidazolonepropionase-like amidohydrolase